MFEPVDAGARVHQIGGAQLFEVAQPLEFRRVDDGHAQRMEHDVPVYVVVEHFAGVGHGATIEWWNWGEKKKGALQDVPVHTKKLHHCSSQKNYIYTETYSECM